MKDINRQIGKIFERYQNVVWCYCISIEDDKIKRTYTPVTLDYKWVKRDTLYQVAKWFPDFQTTYFIISNEGKIYNTIDLITVDYILDTEKRLISLSKIFGMCTTIKLLSI